MSQAAQLPEEDKPALQELSQHVNKIIDAIYAYNKGEGGHDEIAQAFKNLLQDTKSKNALEKKLASYIISELQLIHLKVKVKGKNYNVISFLEDYWAGKITDKENVKLGFKGIAGPLMQRLLRYCKVDMILDHYG